MSGILHTPSDELIAKCMHCALCLPTCPTYALTGLEKSSPRGRIRLMKAVAEGELPITEEYIKEMEFCLDCQACESACPAGVEYGSLVESARIQIADRGYEGRLKRLLKSILLRWLFESPNRLRVVARALRAYQISGLDWLVKRSRVLRLFSRRLHEIQFLAPTVSRSPSIYTLSKHNLSPQTPRYKVGFLTGCIMDVAFAEINVDTVELLVHHGCEVVTPRSQGCCGSLHAHNGDGETARRLARATIDTFGILHLDAIVMNSAGCGAFMKQYGDVLSDDPAYRAPAAELAKKVKDLSEFLVDIGLRVDPQRRHAYASKRVSYHDACHLAHSQKITRQPREIIQSIPFLEFVELPEASWCCGSAGIYNITHFDSAKELLQRKVNNVRLIKPDVVITSNPGCMIQLEHGLRTNNEKVELLHLATFLRRVCCD